MWKDTSDYIDKLNSGEVKLADTEEMKKLMKVLDLMLKYGQKKPLDARMERSKQLPLQWVSRQ